MPNTHATKVLTTEEFRSFLLDYYDPSQPIIDQINAWLARGDGAAIYRAVAFDRSDLGQVKIVSFGSPTAQLEEPEPPTRLPDNIPAGAINWQYQLESLYRGEPV